ncbi:peptidylprolyl isomerase [Deltaproteobacteria bacterium TL4]
MIYKSLIFVWVSWLCLVITTEAQPQVIDFIQIIVNRQILTYTEVQEETQRMRMQIEKSLPEGSEREEQLKDLEHTTIENLVNNLLLIDRARELKFEVGEKEIEERIDQLEQSNPQLLKLYDEVVIKEQIVDDIKRQRVLAMEVDSKVHVDNKEIEQQCKLEGLSERKLGIAQILFRTQNLEAIQAKEVQIRKAFESGESFESLAKQYSEDPNAMSTGGKLGLFKKGELLKEINEVAFQLQQGALSDLVKTQYGYHLLFIYSTQVGNNVDCKTLPPDSENKYTNQLFAKKRTQVLNDYLSQLRKTARIIIKTQPETSN